MNVNIKILLELKRLEAILSPLFYGQVIAKSTL